MVRFGLIGTGVISNKFASDMQYVTNGIVTAVASRDISKANDFAKQYNVDEAYGDYMQMVVSPNVDVVYIGSPHSEHYLHTMAALKAGKHVLCEKPMAMNLAQTTEMVKLAREKNLFFMEALWTRFLPAFRRIEELVADRLIGNIHLAHVDFCFNGGYNPEHRLYNPNLGGGALLDLGIYTSFFLTFFFGKPEKISAYAKLDENQVDLATNAILAYPNGKLATFCCSLIAHSFIEAQLIGEKGRIMLAEPFFRSKKVIYADAQNHTSTEIFDFPGFGYQFETQEVVNCVMNGKTESELMPLSMSLDLAELLEDIRKQSGIIYPFEKQ